MKPQHLGPFRVLVSLHEHAVYGADLPALCVVLLLRHCCVPLVRSGAFTADELLKLWKGLFYCLWMQDKPLIQVRRPHTHTHVVLKLCPRGR